MGQNSEGTQRENRASGPAAVGRQCSGAHARTGKILGVPGGGSLGALPVSTTHGEAERRPSAKTGRFCCVESTDALLRRSRPTNYNSLELERARFS